MLEILIGVVVVVMSIWLSKIILPPIGELIVISLHIALFVVTLILSNLLLGPTYLNGVFYCLTLLFIFYIMSGVFIYSENRRLPDDAWPKSEWIPLLNFLLVILGPIFINFFYLIADYR